MQFRSRFKGSDVRWILCVPKFHLQSIRDTVQECLQKDPLDRTEDDIEILLEFIKNFRVSSFHHIHVFYT